MGYNIATKGEIEAVIRSGLVLSIRSARHQGYDPLFVVGVLANAEHNALALGLDWLGILAAARAIPGLDAGKLIDAVMGVGMIEAGGPRS